MIYVFENQFNSKFWESVSDDVEYVCFPDSTLHWIKKYRFSKKRVPGHQWLLANVNNYDRLVLVSGEDNRRALNKYYNAEIDEFIFFPYLTCEEIEVIHHEGLYGLPENNDRLLILLCLSSPKQDILALSFVTKCTNIKADVACAGYALTDDFIKVPQLLLHISSFLFLEWALHAIRNPRRFYVKVRGYFGV